MKDANPSVILVESYEDALEFYCNKLGFEKSIDFWVGSRRFLYVRWRCKPSMTICLLKAESPEERECVGDQAAGGICGVLYTDDLRRDYECFRSRDVTFTGPPRSGRATSSAQFLDLYGNEFMLVEVKDAA